MFKQKDETPQTGDSGNGSREFYRSLVSIVVPIAIQSFIGSAVNSADVFMLGLVGQSELAAVSLANQFQFLLWGIFFGINSGITLMSAQYWGKKDTGSIQVIMGIGLKIAVVVTGLVAVSCTVFPRALMTIYTADRELIEIGASYLRIVGTSYILYGIGQVYETTLRSVGKAALSTIISSTALGLNVFLNAVFIFGLLGAPRLGVVGVAVATFIARAIEVVICLILLIRGTVFKVDLTKVLGRSGLLFKDFVKYSTPALINDFTWTVAFSIYSVIMGHMNSDIVAANSVITTVRDLTAIIGFSIGSGATVIFGIEIGEGRYEDVKRDTGRCLRLAFAVSIATGLLLIALKPLIFTLFTLTPRAQGYLSTMIYISSYYVIGQIVNTFLICGVFRAGGETRWGMICDIITMWGVSLPIGFLSAFVLKLPPMWVYFILCLDEFYKIPFVIKHYKSYKWINNITR